MTLRKRSPAAEPLPFPLQLPWSETPAGPYCKWCCLLPGWVLSVWKALLVQEMWAMWMIEIGLVQVYDDNGHMLRTVNLFEELEPVRAAA